MCSPIPDLVLRRAQERPSTGSVMKRKAETKPSSSSSRAARTGRGQVGLNESAGSLDDLYQTIGVIGPSDRGGGEKQRTPRGIGELAAVTCPSPRRMSLVSAHELRDVPLPAGAKIPAGALQKRASADDSRRAILQLSAGLPPLPPTQE